MYQQQIKEYFINEAEALLTRVNHITPFGYTMPMVANARITPFAEKEINKSIQKSKEELRRMITKFQKGVFTTESIIKPYRIQNEYTLLKLKLNSMLDQVDIFADVLSQRGDNRTGILVSGLDVLARDGLKVKDFQIKIPLICFLDRGIGAAIRRRKTPLPGGYENPVTIIQIPREKIPGFGIASSLIHELGHQIAAIYDLNRHFKMVFDKKALQTGEKQWGVFSLWISEILADLWSIGKLGIGSTLGLMGVLNLPYYFIFRINKKDPHPLPYLRVKISCEIGRRLYPDKQWNLLSKQWESLYPLELLKLDKQKEIRSLEGYVPKMVDILLKQSCPKLDNRNLKSLFGNTCSPANLRYYRNSLSEFSEKKPGLSPVHFFAALGQAKADNKISAKDEATIILKALNNWALMKN